MRIQVNYRCTENWEKMKPQGDGRFCASCEKEVVDFSTWTDKAIAHKLQKGEKLCGRISKDRLQRPLVYTEPKKNPLLALSILTAMAASTNLMAQENNTKDHPKIQLQKQGYTALELAEFAEYPKQTNILYRGKVVDEDSNMPLPFANVMIYQDSNFIAGASTDIEGFFELEFNNYQPDLELQIRLTYLGFKDTSFYILPEDLYRKMEELDEIGLEQTETLSLEQEVLVMGMMVPFESLDYNPEGEKRNWFGRNGYRLKQYFHRLRYR